ncbi:hypothetical protein Tco_0320569 [Tanacetum coccineum]
MEGDFPRLHLNDIEDMLLLVVQNKLFNLEGDVIVDLAVALRMYTRRIVIQKIVEDLQLGVIYEDKLKRKRLIRSDELLKFSDGTLKYVHDIIHDRLMNFKLGYNKDMDRRNEIASEVWSELKETYDKMDGFVVFNLMHKINNLKQGRTTCTYDAKSGSAKHTKLIILMQFLMGLNDVYQPIRSTILAKDPLPNTFELP